MKRFVVGFFIIVGNTLAYLFPPLVGERPYTGPDVTSLYGPCPPL